MRENKSNFLTLARYINQEMLLQELFRAKEFSLLKYSKKKKKIKILITKIFYSIIFGILPIIPLVAYFKMQEDFAEGLPISIAMFAGSLLFVFFFALEFLNIFFMGMIEVSLILSNPIFRWLKSLPLTNNTLTKLKLYSVFRSFDIPIIVIIFTFPIVMLVGTLNVLLFLICLGISTCHVILSLSTLVLFGEKMNKILNTSKLNSRKTMAIRLINTFGYVILLFGSLIFVQWATSSIHLFFTFSMVQRHPAIINLILSTLPYPFSSSYFISFITSANQVHYHYWISIFCGFGLFVIFTYWISRSAIRGLVRLTASEEMALNKYEKTTRLEEEIKIEIKIRNPIIAHFIKDLQITTRNLKVFLSAITPIIISFVFTFTFNFTVLGSKTPLDTDFFYNFALILAFQPVISGMLIYNLLNIEGSGEGMMSALPINPKNQAKAKLLYFTIIQTISVICPYLVYMFRPGFIDLLITVLISLPFSLIILLSMFELHVYFFGRTKYHFLLEQVNPENKTIKWVFIYVLEYVFYFLITSISVVLYFIGLEFLIFNFTLLILLAFGILFLSFYLMFTPVLKPKGEVKSQAKLEKEKIFLHMKQSYKSMSEFKPNLLTRKPWLSITVLLFMEIFLTSLGILYSAFFRSEFHVSSFRVLFWFSLIPLLTLFLIQRNFIPKFRQNSYRMLFSSKQATDFLKWSFLGTICIVLVHLIFSYALFIPYRPGEFIFPEYDVYTILGIFSIAIGHEILFRGIILQLLLSKYAKLISFYLISFITFVYYLLFYIIYLLIRGLSVLFLFENLLYIFVMQLILTFLYMKSNSIYPAFLVHLISTLLECLPFFYFGIIIYF